MIVFPSPISAINIFIFPVIPDVEFISGEYHPRLLQRFVNFDMYNYLIMQKFFSSEIKPLIWDNADSVCIILCDIFLFF